MPVQGWSNAVILKSGESQLMGETYNASAENSALTTLPALLSYLNSIVPQGIVIDETTLYSLCMFNEAFIDFLPVQPGTNPPARIQWTDLTSTDEIDAFVNEIISVN